jgi:hypothetical protein
LTTFHIFKISNIPQISVILNQNVLVFLLCKKSSQHFDVGIYEGRAEEKVGFRVISSNVTFLSNSMQGAG